MTNTEKIQCSHEPCLCMVTAVELESDDPSEAYCGDSCRRGEEREAADACVCGHPACDSQ